MFRQRRKELHLYVTGCEFSTISLLMMTTGSDVTSFAILVSIIAVCPGIDTIACMLVSKV